jgi:hypothetical protein
MRPRGLSVAGLLAVSIVAAVVGLVQAGLIARGPAAGPPDSHAGLDDLQASVARSQFLAHDHADPIPTGPAGAGPAGAGPAGYQMPAAMMPGMPAEGYSRLMVELHMANDGSELRTLDPENEFILRNERGEAWQTEGDTFGGKARLNPSNGMVGAVFFDVPTDGATTHQWVLEWKRGRHTARLAVSPGAAAHSH